MRRLIGTLTLLAVVASGCRTDEPATRSDRKPVRDADTRCESTERSDSFYAENATYRDPDALELEGGDPRRSGLEVDLLQAATDEIKRSRDVLSFLVLHRGKLVWERYFNGSGMTSAENIHSASKAILSLALGRAIDEGVLALDDPIADHLPSSVVPPRLAVITVADLATMSAGLGWRENVTEFEEIAGQDSYVRAILSQGSESKPGTEFHYSTGLTQVLSAVITEATGASTCSYATREVLAPMGVTVEHWLTMPDGYDAGGHSVFMTPRELARMGRFILEDGEGDGGEGSVGRGWLRRSLAERWSLGCGAPSQERGYGYLWWRSDIGGNTVWEAQGYGGQGLMMVPSLDLVMVMTHDTYGDDKKQIVPITEVLTNFVIPAADGEIDPDHTCRSFDIYRADIDGSGITRLTDHPTLDTWGMPSPDGQRIAYESRQDLNFEVYAMGADGSAPERLTTNEASDAFPAWSPDGELIAFARDGTQAGIYTMRPDGRRQRRLTRGLDDTPAWSNDGRRIAFHRGDEDGPGDIKVMTTRGRNVETVDGTQGGIAPAWSPDDDTLAYYERDRRGPVVYTIDAGGGKPRRIAAGRDPKWLPDGSLVFSQTPPRGTSRIVRWSKGDIEVVVDTPGDDLIPMPSADGKWLTFSSASARAPQGSGADKMSR